MIFKNPLQSRLFNHTHRHGDKQSKPHSKPHWRWLIFVIFGLLSLSDPAANSASQMGMDETSIIIGVSWPLLDIGTPPISDHLDDVGMNLPFLGDGRSLLQRWTATEENRRGLPPRAQVQKKKDAIQELNVLLLEGFSGSRNIRILPFPVLRPFVLWDLPQNRFKNIFTLKKAFRVRLVEQFGQISKLLVMRKIPVFQGYLYPDRVFGALTKHDCITVTLYNSLVQSLIQNRRDSSKPLGENFEVKAPIHFGLQQLQEAIELELKKIYYMEWIRFVRAHRHTHFVLFLDQKGSPESDRSSTVDPFKSDLQTRLFGLKNVSWAADSPEQAFLLSRERIGLTRGRTNALSCQTIHRY